MIRRFRRCSEGVSSEHLLPLELIGLFSLRLQPCEHDVGFG